MKGLYFYKFVSEYPEDITKNDKLSIEEIDSNFITLKNSDIKNIDFDADNGLLKLTQNNNETLIANIDLSHYIKDFNVKWDDENKYLIFYFNDQEICIDKFIQEIKPISIGNGLISNPLSINPLELTSTYKSVERIIDTRNNESLDSVGSIEKGDMYLTIENYKCLGNLYNFDSVKQMNQELDNGWHVPSKEEWDDMLNAIEICDEDKTHDELTINYNGGKYAGKLLKSKKFWKHNQNITNELDVINSYGFSVLPINYEYHENNTISGLNTEFWTISEYENNKVYTKHFAYDKNTVTQNAQLYNAYRSIRLIKEYNGSNFQEIEIINGLKYETVLMPSLKSELGYNIWTVNNVYDTNYNPLDINHSINFQTVYYLNYWDGEKWHNKKLGNGDSFFVKSTQIAYMIIDNALSAIPNETDINNALQELHQTDDAIFEKIHEVENATALDLEDVKNVTQQIIIQEGSVFDCAKGTLVLNSIDPTKKIIIHLNGDYGTF